MISKCVIEASSAETVHLIRSALISSHLDDVGKSRRAFWTPSPVLGSLGVYLLHPGSTHSLLFLTNALNKLPKLLLLCRVFPLSFAESIIVCHWHPLFNWLSAICSRPFCFRWNLHLNFCIWNELISRKDDLLFSFLWIKNWKWSNSLRNKTVFFFLGKQQISGLFTFAQNSIIEKSKMHLFKKSLFFSSSSKNVSTEQSNICLFIYFNCIHNQANP